MNFSSIQLYHIIRYVHLRDLNKEISYLEYIKIIKTINYFKHSLKYNILEKFFEFVSICEINSYHSRKVFFQ